MKSKEELELELESLIKENRQNSTAEKSIKTLINSFYGILAFPFANRYVNVDIASAITSCGRHAVKQGEKFTNDILRNPNDELKNILDEIKAK